jgi:hypothetical protein
MVEKKLLTLACAAGILACGACFSPGLNEPKPQLPPALASVHVIAIQVEDGTGSNLFDSVIMSNATAGNFNRLWKDFGVRARALNAGGPSDSVLRIIVLRKTVSITPEKNGRQFYPFEMAASYTLTTADGRILESMPERLSQFGTWFDGKSLPETWNSNPLRQDAAYALAMTAGDMLQPSKRTN